MSSNEVKPAIIFNALNSQTGIPAAKTEVKWE